uniref:Cilia- and flagella-associated protein 52 n=1 Tax=Gouania willdenowi TaxID=441366 RepID=A0A8C5DJV9_GOUWI
MFFFLQFSTSAISLGRVVSGLQLHPDRQHLIYPVGCTIILKKISNGIQDFLHGHTNNVSCISVSKSGKYIASGQVNSMGYKAPIVIWDYSKKAIYAELVLHMAKVEALDFSPNDKYLVSLGGVDDGSVVVWNIETKQAICGSLASPQNAGHCLTVKYSNTNDLIFASAGSETLRVWKMDPENRKLSPTECRTGKMRRTVKCVEITENDQLLFCGTTSGDILKITLETGLLSACGPVKTKNNLGVNVIRVLKSGNLLVGSGSGLLSIYSENNFKKKAQVEQGVTSITVNGDEQHLFVGTQDAKMYRLNLETFQPELVSSSHNNAINDVAIPFGVSELFATCSKNDIRLWKKGKPIEILRITVPNLTCNALHIMLDGASFISAWSDGKIRVFGPESGRLMLIIPDAHRMGVTAIAGTRDCERIISGGEEGQVRCWELQNSVYRLLGIMAEHKTTITSINIKSDDKQCVTTSADGSCIIWDLVMFGSLQMVIDNTKFQVVCYHPEEYQIITSGSDRKVTYWDVFNGSRIRSVVASESGTINGMHITQDGNHFVTGGDDKLVKVWNYMEGQATHVGMPHGGSITSVRICSNNRIIVSTSADGAIFQWRFPHPPVC